MALIWLASVTTGDKLRDPDMMRASARALVSALREYPADAALGAIAFYVMVPSTSWRGTLSAQVDTTVTVKVVALHGPGTGTTGALSAGSRTAISSAGAYVTLPDTGQAYLLFVVQPVVAESGGNVEALGSIGTPFDIDITFQIDLIPPS